MQFQAANLREFVAEFQRQLCGQHEIAALLIRMARENSWGYTRIKGALKNHHRRRNVAQVT
jgi:hypothetical protein